MVVVELSAQHPERHAQSSVLGHQHILEKKKKSNAQWKCKASHILKNEIRCTKFLQELNAKSYSTIKVIIKNFVGSGCTQT